MTLHRQGILLAVALVSAISVACGRTTKAASSPPLPSVAVIEVTPQDVPIYAEYAAQTFARDLVEVRGRVDGYLEKRLFQVGSNVKTGEVLYVLDLRPY